MRSSLLAGALATVALVATVASVTPAAGESTCAPATLNAGLHGVAATSQSNAWAVGYSWNGTVAQTLIERWNGSTWCTVPTPDPGGPAQPNTLESVADTSASGAWAAGSYGSSAGQQTLILHWDGTAWQQVPSPDPSTVGINYLFAVAATSASDAWAVGYYGSNTGARTLILHWDGTAWTQVPSPSPGLYPHLAAVAATSASDAWAVGTHNDPAETLTLRWNGTSWVHVASPTPGTGIKTGFLSGVTATPAGQAWVVGSGERNSQAKSLLLAWTGNAWHMVTTRDPVFRPSFAGVAATSL